MSVEINKLSNYELVEAAKNLVAKEKRLDVEILLLVKEVKHRKIHLAEGYGNLADYCARVLGMSEDQAWKRSQAVETITDFPWTFDLLKRGETKLSQLAMLKPKLSKANESILRTEVSGKSRLELKDFLETVDREGNRIERVPTTELKLKCRKELMNKLSRIRSLKAKTKHLPDMESIVEEMADLWLAKYDPIEKAKRAETKPTKNDGKSTCDGAGEKNVISHQSVEQAKRYIPSKIRHKVMVHADKEGCSYTSPDGRRCGSVYKLQIDHRVPLALGGTNSYSNLQILCASHNQYMADKILGRGFMDHRRR